MLSPKLIYFHPNHYLFKVLKNNYIMADLQLPSYGGLTRFNEEYNSKLKIKPSTVIGMITIVVITEIVLHFFI
jgi:preprotein translocase subunit Sec61beta